MNLRFSLLTTFVIVAIGAIFSLSLREPTSIWSDLCIMITLFVMAAIAARAFSCRDRRKRLTAAGAVIFGGGYFAIVFSGLFFFPLWDNLPTSKSLGYIYDWTYGPAMSAPQSLQEYMNQQVMAAPDGAQDEGSPPVWPSRNQSQVLLIADPGLAAFSQVGHCAYSILFAVIGGLCAYWWSREPRPQAHAPNTEVSSASLLE